VPFSGPPNTKNRLTISLNKPAEDQWKKKGEGSTPEEGGEKERLFSSLSDWGGEYPTSSHLNRRSEGGQNREKGGRREEKQNCRARRKVAVLLHSKKAERTQSGGRSELYKDSSTVHAASRVFRRDRGGGGRKESETILSNNSLFRYSSREKEVMPCPYWLVLRKECEGKRCGRRFSLIRNDSTNAAAAVRATREKGGPRGKRDRDVFGLA